MVWRPIITHPQKLTSDVKSVVFSILVGRNTAFSQPLFLSVAFQAIEARVVVAPVYEEKGSEGQFSVPPPPELHNIERPKMFLMYNCWITTCRTAVGMMTG